MNITLIGFLLGMLLLALPLAVMHRYGLRISTGRALSAIVRMVVYVGIVGGAMYTLQKHGGVGMSLLFVLVLIVLSSVTAILRSRLSLRVMFVPVTAAVAVSVVVTPACRVRHGRACEPPLFPACCRHPFGRHYNGVRRFAFGIL